MSCSARKKQRDTLFKKSKKTLKSSSEEWHSEEVKTDSATDDNEVSPLGVGKLHRGKQNLQVSVLTHYSDFFTC